MTLPVEAPLPPDPRRGETRVLLVLWAACAIAIGVVLCTWILRTRPENLHWVWIQALALASFPGKLAILGGLAEGSPLDPWGVALLSVGVDAVLAITLALILSPILRLPGIGTWLRGANARAAQVLASYPGLRRTAFWGAALFVALPLPGSGWIGGTFAGQLLGLSRPMGVAAIVIGSTAVSTAFAGLAFALGAEAETLLRSPWMVALGLVVSAAVLWIVWRRFRRELRRA